MVKERIRDILKFHEDFLEGVNHDGVEEEDTRRKDCLDDIGHDVAPRTWILCNFGEGSNYTRSESVQKGNILCFHFYFSVV